MAASGKGMAILGLGALMVLVMMAQPADASKFDVWAGSGCTGNHATLNACGCSEVPAGLNGGYSWTYEGQTSAAYNGAGCTGVAHTHFSGSVRDCSGFGWQSFFIQC